MDSTNTWRNISSSIRRVMAGSKTLTIALHPTGTELTDFPNLITGEHMPQVFWDNVKSDGADIILYDSASNKLKRELVSIDVANKTMELYVKKTLSATTPTLLTMEYCDAAGAETNDTDTWIASIARVWHMNNGVDADHIHESTAAADHGAKGAARNTAAADLSNGTGTLASNPTSIAAGTGGTTVTVTGAGNFTITIPANQYLRITNIDCTTVAINYSTPGERSITVTGTGTFLAEWLDSLSSDEESGAFSGDKAQYFDKDAYIQHTCEIANNADAFCEIIYKTDEDADAQRLILGFGTCFLLTRYTNNRSGIRCDSAGIMAGDWQVIGTGNRTWHYVWGSYDQDGTNSILDDGVDLLTGSANSYTKLGVTLYYGSWFGGWDTGALLQLKGYIAEARIHTTIPSAAWKIATYNSLLNNASTYHVVTPNTQRIVRKLLAMHG
jgi:hypothetical protein